LSSSGRVSVACSKSAMRVSRHSSLPKKNGALAATGRPARRRSPARRSSGRRSASGSTWRCSWTLVQAASGRDGVGVGGEALDAADVDLEVLPRAAKICSLSSA
jgi:hypothetical protein